jgi:hypothetical protein
MPNVAQRLTTADDALALGSIIGLRSLYSHGFNCIDSFTTRCRSATAAPSGGDVAWLPTQIAHAEDAHFRNQWRADECIALLARFDGGASSHS